MVRPFPVPVETRGGLLRQLRENRHLTQDQLARIARVKQRTVSRLELGQREGRQRTWMRLEAALGLTPGDLLRVEVTG